MFARLKPRTMPSGLVSAKDIPSLSVLYRNKTLRPSSNEDLPSPNQEYNDKVCTIQGDITKLQIDAIVNAANSGLRGGGGVDGAIQRAAGPQLLEECATLGGCETGSAKITDAYNLPCKKVIHAVGPIFESLQESEPLLRGCYRKSLSLAVENDCKTVAFPAISTGVYGYPSSQAARAAVREVFTFLKKPEGKKLDKVIFCNFLDKDVDAYAKVLPYVYCLPGKLGYL
jgi:O-acetyl-ADP-ribose deacetylase (regulator of RNase III)